ncbi:hypothetical protein IHE55_17460 [Streptomyces pactum]|uniref:Uncharacterized protein n=1 Tax=Streptomyces pactum TaxID=68249 RepID=A0ABS0NMS0_9ACTN|nr:DUF6882 domain-containing protein [Streptomyces pactum]MBH5336466.1 hypothetical protein [Streptomyces pactum]
MHASNGNPGPHGTGGTFSEQLTSAARPHLGWVCEQLDLFDRLVPHGATYYNLDEPMVARSGVTLRGHILGTYALDGTWLWAWGNDGFRETAGAQRAGELREFGEREGIPELTERMLDLNHFPNPRLAADHLMLICMGLLDARGGAIAVINERGRAFLVVDDPAVPKAEPRAGRLEQPLRNGAALLPGPALKTVQGWFKRHGIEPEYGPGQVAGVLPGGDRVVVDIGGDRIGDIVVTGADGGEPVSARAPEQELIEPRRTPGAHPELMFPESLLPVAAAEIAYSIRRTRAMVEYADQHLEFDGRPPVWDEAAGELRFPGGGLKARRLGAYDLDERWFAWAAGTEDIRDRFRAAAGLAPDADVPELAGGRLDLRPYVHCEAFAVALARTAAGVAGYVFTSLGNEFWVVTDERLPAPGTDPEITGEEIRAGAGWLHGVTPADVRGATMRTVMEAYCDRLGLQVHHYGQPDFLSAVSGLYETRVFFAPDGTITHASCGLLATPHG